MARREQREHDTTLIISVMNIFGVDSERKVANKRGNFDTFLVNKAADERRETKVGRHAIYCDYMIISRQRQVHVKTICTLCYY